MRVQTREAPSSVATASRARGDNLLLGALPVAEADELIALCERVELSSGDVLSEPGARIRHAYFPTGGFVSLVAAVDKRRRVEVALVGAEGMLGASLLLDVKVAPFHALVQGSGSALRVEATRFASELDRSQTLSQIVKRYLYVLMSQLAQTVACTRFHLLEARLARWLLMTRDCVRSCEFHLTQESMASRLGVRRAGITCAAGALQKRNLIRYTRGDLTILDGGGLEAVSCTCYAAAKDMYATLIGAHDPGREGPRSYAFVDPDVQLDQRVAKRSSAARTGLSVRDRTEAR